MKRIEAAKEEGNWKASSTSIENTIEIPSIPKTKRGLKFQAAAEELNLISDEFFELRNHNSQYTSALEKLKKEWLYLKEVVIDLSKQKYETKSSEACIYIAPQTYQQHPKSHYDIHYSSCHLAM